MLTISKKAAEKLREQIIHKCFQTGIGFRMLVNYAESGETMFSIKLDRQYEGDKVIDSSGVKLFLDTPSVARIMKYQLDYNGEPGGGFILKTRQEAKID